MSLATYTLFLLDARRQTFWERLDDYIYYIKAFGNSVEFCFGIFLFFNGAWILIFESGMFDLLVTNGLRHFIRYLPVYGNYFMYIRSICSQIVRSSTS